MPLNFDVAFYNWLKILPHSYTLFLFVLLFLFFTRKRNGFQRTIPKSKQFLGSVFSIESICIIIYVFIVLVCKKLIYFCEYINKNNVIRTVKNKFSFVNILGPVWWEDFCFYFQISIKIIFKKLKLVFR